MNLWRLPLVITIALAAHYANAQVPAGTYTCATVTTNAAGQIRAISSNPCVQVTMDRLLLSSGGDIILYSGGNMLCQAC